MLEARDSVDFRVLVAVLGALSLALPGCKKTPEPPAGAGLLTQTLRPSGGAAAPAASVSLEPVHITWIDPAGFKRVPPKNAMRKATYIVPRQAPDSEDGELAVFYFGPGQGGTVDANMNRWLAQFKDAKPADVRRADRNVHGLVEHTVELDSASYDGSMPGMGQSKVKAGYGLLGAIVEAPSGSYFFKLTGPAITVKGAKALFYELLDSIQPAS